MNDEVIQLNYQQPKLGRIFSAHLFDLFIMFVFSALFLVGGLFALQSMPFYQDNQKTQQSIQIETKLYVKSNDSVLLVSDYLSQNNDMTYNEKVTYFSSNLEYFFDEYLVTNTKVTDGKDIYKKILLEIKDDNSDSLFDNDGKRLYTDLDKDETYFNAYKTVLTKYSLGYLNYIEGYSNCRKINIWSNITTILICVTLGIFVTYFMFPLIFKRGRKTLGFLLNQIGYVSYDGFNPSILRLSLSFLFKWILVFLASIMTLGLPLFISVGMFFLSKKHQTLTEYIFALYVVETSSSIIYLDYYEYDVNQKKINSNKDCQDIVKNKESEDLHS